MLDNITACLKLVKEVCERLFLPKKPKTIYGVRD